MEQTQAFLNLVSADTFLFEEVCDTLLTKGTQIHICMLKSHKSICLQYNYHVHVWFISISGWNPCLIVHGLLCTACALQ